MVQMQSAQSINLSRKKLVCKLQYGLRKLGYQDICFISGFKEREKIWIQTILFHLVGNKWNMAH